MITGDDVRTWFWTAHARYMGWLSLSDPLKARQYKADAEARTATTVAHTGLNLAAITASSEIRKSAKLVSAYFARTKGGFNTLARHYNEGYPSAILAVSGIRQAATDPELSVPSPEDTEPWQLKDDAGAFVTCGHNDACFSFLWHVTVNGKSIVVCDSSTDPHERDTVAWLKTARK